MSIREGKWFRLLLVAGISYIALLPLWWCSIDALTVVAAASADLVYHLLDPRMSIRADGKVIRFFINEPGQRSWSGLTPLTRLRFDMMTYGLPMLTSLVLVTRADSLRAKARTLIVGLVIMIVAAILAVMMSAKVVSLQLHESVSLGATADNGDRSSFFSTAVHGYGYSQPVVAVTIWLMLILLGSFKEKSKQRLQMISIGRNAVCPCGSSRKYKRCCGRA